MKPSILDSRNILSSPTESLKSRVKFSQIKNESQNDNNNLSPILSPKSTSRDRFRQVQIYKKMS